MVNKETLCLAAMLLGSIGGAQIWLSAGLTAGMGAFSPLIWLAGAAVMAMAALCILRCASFGPQVSGGSSCVRTAYGHFYGFIAGWSTLWAESVILGMMAIAVSEFISLLIQLPFIASVGLKALFIAAVVVATVFGSKTPRAWSMFRLLLLFIFMAMGAIFVAARPGTLFFPLTTDLLGILPALAIAMWAFSGFEIAPLPVISNECDIRKAVTYAFGAAVVIFVLFSLFIQAASGQTEISVSAAAAGMSTAIGLGMIGIAIAALAAITAFASPNAARVPQVCTTAMAMTADGMLPKIIAKYRRGDILLIPLATQAVVAFAASLSNDIGGLIFFSFSLLAISLISGCLAYARLLRYYTRKPYEKPKPAYSVIVITIVILVTLTQLPPTPLLVAVMVMLLGIPFYIHSTTKCELPELKERVMSNDYIEACCDKAKNSYLGALFSLFKKLMRENK